MTRPLIRALLVAGLVAQLAACSSMKESMSTGFGFFSKDTSVKPTPLTEFTPSVTLGAAWHGSVGEAGGYVFSPAIAGGSVFAAGNDGKVSRFDLDSGQAAWTVDSGKKLSGGVGAGEGVVAVGTAKAEVLAFDAGDGHPLWQSRVSGEVLSAPAILNDLVVVRTGDGRLHALDARDGKRKWVYQRPTPALTLRSFAGVLAERGAVFAGFAGGKLAALDLGSGAVGWEANVALPRGATELERIADITSTPVSDRGQIFAVAYQGRVVSIDISTGNTIWARDMSSFSGLAVDAYNVYVSDAKGSVIALDKASGASVWKQDKLAARQLSAPVAVGRYVVVGDLEGYVHFLSRDDGSFAGRIATDGSPIRAKPLDIGSGALVQTSRGGLYAIRVQ
jgi:outer membrane assembly lipoprotein YfgL